MDYNLLDKEACIVIIKMLNNTLNKYNDKLQILKDDLSVLKDEKQIYKENKQLLEDTEDYKNPYNKILDIWFDDENLQKYIYRIDSFEHLYDSFATWYEEKYGSYDVGFNGRAPKPIIKKYLIKKQND
tara:strand:+ start:97 stop:480 length:384 start_codon:yes stop_codon:yes gene_type:complete